MRHLKGQINQKEYIKRLHDIIRLDFAFGNSLLTF